MFGSKTGLFFGAAMVITLVGAGCVSQQAPSPQADRPIAPAVVGEQAPAGQTAVAIKDFSFQPSEMTVKKGAVVTWTNQDSVPHSIIYDPRAGQTGLSGPASSALTQGDSYSFTFEEVGDFDYHCQFHPGMKGHIRVTE